MFDALMYFSKIATSKNNILDRLNIKPKEYFLATIHRAENTDSYERLKNILEDLSEIEEKIVFPIHPRTRRRIEEFKLEKLIGNNIMLIEPVGYLDMINLEKNAKAILTDSGGVQKEALWLKVPCITLRDETEWVETVEYGWNILIGANKEKIIGRVNNITYGVDVDFKKECITGKICEIVKEVLKE